MYQSGVLTIVTKTILAPIERWRIIAQTQFIYPYRPNTFNNALEYIKSKYIFMSGVPSEQGFTSLWRGNMSTVGIFFAHSLFQIGIYDSMKSFIKEWV